MSRCALLAGAVVVALLAACSSPAGSAPSTGERSSPSADAGSGNLPPGCDPLPLLAPDGSRLRLDGTWIDQSRDDAGTMTWYIRTSGNCFYGTGTVADVPEGLYTHADTVQTYTGLIQPDYTVEGAFVHLGPTSDTTRNLPMYFAIPLEIEFTDEGGIVIRELREEGVIGPRCPDPTFCIPPLLLAPRDD